MVDDVEEVVTSSESVVEVESLLEVETSLLDVEVSKAAGRTVVPVVDSALKSVKSMTPVSTRTAASTVPVRIGRLEADTSAECMAGVVGTAVAATPGAADR